MLGVNVGDLWPVILIVVGLSIIFGGMRVKSRRMADKATVDMDSVNVTAALSSSEQRVLSQDFKGGQVTAIMGGVEIDLRDAHVLERPAKIDATVIMGGAEISVPEGWVVRFDNVNFMGGSGDERKRRHMEPPADNKPDLLITGLVLMGAVEIKS
ncbi:MAG: hypothetical protein FJ319_07035 [SAR202 cluster bacterium]|nr:hypothetical protein [SAR202 cluster bacterium]